MSRGNELKIVKIDSIPSNKVKLGEVRYDVCCFNRVLLIKKTFSMRNSTRGLVVDRVRILNSILFWCGEIRRRHRVMEKEERGWWFRRRSFAFIDSYGGENRAELPYYSIRHA